jgi:hypothetical protein
MRFIIHEQPYERPLLSGRLRYMRDGAPMGAVETWRLTAAPDGYRFLRIDMDARAAPSGHSLLYHLTLNPAGRPEQLKYRFWGYGHEVSGSAVWEGDEVIARRRVNGLTFEDVACGVAFWLPSGAGLSLLAQSAGETRGIRMTIDPDPSALMAFVETPVTIEWGAAAEEQFGAELLSIQPLHVTWGDQRRAVWLDDDRRPLRVWRDDGLTAVAERLIRYGE